MNPSPLISFITVNYNGLGDTCELIESLQTAIQSISYEIIVVDNASTRNEAEIIGNRFPEVITLRSPRNLGFAGGNNLGIRQARGRYLFLINNDTYLVSDPNLPNAGLQHLINRLESHPDIGAVSPKIRFAQAPQHIQFAGFTPLSPITLRNQTIGYGKPDDGAFNAPRPTPYLHGAALMLKREVIDRVGPMPEVYFLYYEELDWCAQMTRYGYQLWYEPRCTVFHKESQSTGRQSPLRTFYLTRNRLLFAWRNCSEPARCLSVLYQCTIAAAKSSLLFVFDGRPDLARAVYKGILAFIRLPHKKD